MAYRFIKGLILLLTSNFCFASLEGYIENELLNNYSKVEIKPLNGALISPCSGEVVDRSVRFNLNSKRLVCVENCKIGKDIQIQRHWYSFKGFNNGYVLTAPLSKGQIIEKGQFKVVLVEDNGSLLINEKSQKAIAELSVGTVLTLKNTIANEAALVGDEVDVLIKYRSARIKTIGVALENSMPGEKMKIRVNEKVLNSTLDASGVAYVY